MCCICKGNPLSVSWQKHDREKERKWKEPIFKAPTFFCSRHNSVLSSIIETCFENSRDKLLHILLALRLYWNIACHVLAVCNSSFHWYLPLIIISVVGESLPLHLAREIPSHMVVPGHRSIVNQTRYSSTHHVLCSSGVEKIIKVRVVAKTVTSWWGVSCNKLL